MQIRDLNAGTFGFVELALDKSTGQQVAIKFIERGDKVGLDSQRLQQIAWLALLSRTSSLLSLSLSVEEQLFWTVITGLPINTNHWHADHQVR